jgi:hypothetical protein
MDIVQRHNSCKNCGGRETAVARQCPHATIKEMSRYEIWRVQPLLWSDWVSAFPRRRIQATLEALCFLCGPCRGFITGTKKIVEFGDNSLPGHELGSGGVELRDWDDTITEGSSVGSKVWLWREDLACDLKALRVLWYRIFWVCSYREAVIVSVLKSIARKRLVESVIEWGH